MAVILKFPNSDTTKKADIVDIFVQKIGDKIGLTAEEIATVVNSYRTVHSSLTETFEAPMEIPASISLDERQIDIINKVLAEHMSDLFAFSASLIIGLLAREQVNNRNI